MCADVVLVWWLTIQCWLAATRAIADLSNADFVVREAQSSHLQMNLVKSRIGIGEVWKAERYWLMLADLVRKLLV